MKNIFNLLDANAPEHRNAYDLSQRHIHSQKVGQKLPIMCLETLPKDHIEIDLLSLVRSMPINTAAFSRIKANYEFIFVPYQQLWHGWNQFFLQNEENMSSGNSFNHASLPYFDLVALLRNHLLIYDVLYRCFMHEEDSDTPETFNENLSDFNNLLKSVYGVPLTDEFGFSSAQNCLRLLDMLGYGSFYSIYESFWTAYNQTIIEDIWNFTDYSDRATLNDFVNTLMETIVIAEAWPNTFDTIEQFKLSAPFPQLILWSYFTAPDIEDYRVSQRNCNPFRILAYHKAWQDYTLNKRIQSYDPFFFNADAKTSYTPAEMLKLFSINYDTWDYDFFTGVFDSPQTGDVSVVSGSASLVFPDSRNKVNNSIQTDSSGKAGLYLGGNLVDYNSQISGLSVYDIKRAEFLQRWKENHLRAGHKGQNQALGQWNTRFRYLSDEYSDFIASFDLNVNIDEVINTADNQGDISGKGIGTNNGHFTYNVHDAGVLICLCSLRPRAEYDAVMIDRQNTSLVPFDFPSPFFDNLGLEAVPYYLCNLYSDATSYTPESPETGDARIIGYAPRYLSWKTAVDKVHGAFMSAKYGIAGSPGGFSIWATPRKELENPNSVSNVQHLFYVNPHVVDSIFASIADSSQDSDHFIFNDNFIIHVVRNLSVSGMPNWNV